MRAFGKRSWRNSRNSLLIQTCFLLYITSFSISRSFKDLLLRGLGEDFFSVPLCQRKAIVLTAYFCPKSPMLDFMVNHSYFFFLGPGIHGLLFEFWVVFTKMLAEKFETLVVFMKCKKKKLKPPGA